MNISSIGNGALDIANINKTQLETENFTKSLESAMKNQNNVDDVSKDEKNKQMKKACIQFESYFLNMMYKSMRKTVNSISTEPKSQAQSTFEEMLDGQMCTNIAESGGIGLSDMLYKEIKS